MNDLPPIDDDLLSAHLDGETSTADAARIDADPAARARLAELRAARDLAATPVRPLDDDTFTRLRATALDSAATAPSDELAERRSRRGPSMALLGAAAAVLVLIVGVTSIIASIDSNDQDTASVSLDAVADDLEFHADSGDLESAAGAADDLEGDDAGDDAGDDSLEDSPLDDSLDADDGADAANADALEEAFAQGVGGDGVALYGFRLADVDEVADLDELRSRLQEGAGAAPEPPAATTTAPRAPGSEGAGRAAEWNAVRCGIQIRVALERDPGTVIEKAVLDAGPFAHSVITIGGVPAVVAFFEADDDMLTLVYSPARSCTPVGIERDFLGVLED